MDIVVGFTGTSIGMNDTQARGVRNMLLEIIPNVAHHGMCKGADANFHWIVRNMFGAFCRIEGHPPINKINADMVPVDVMHPDKDYIVRDKDIVDAADVMLATPFCPEIRRSGTWTTVRYARKREKPTIIFMPDGQIIKERWHYG